MFHSKLALVTKTCFVAYKILHNFHFGGNLALVQVLAEFHKKTEQVDMDCYSAEQGGALPPEQSRLRTRRHAPSHAAAWLREPVVKWTSPRRAHPLPSVLPLRGCLAFLFFSPDADDLAAPLKFPSPASLPSHPSTPIASPSS
jgi:hypothetical protein